MKNKPDKNNSHYRFMATCPKGLESILAKELLRLGAGAVQEHVAAVFFESNLVNLYFIMSWTRVANKIVLVLLRDRLDSAEEFDQQVSQIPWEQYFSIQQSIAVAFNGTNNAFRSPSYGAQRTKDGIQTRFNELYSINPQEGLKILPRVNVDLDDPDVRVHVRVFKTRFVVGIDLIGESLHKRGYRSISGAAPLKENLAAAILLMAGWSDKRTEECVDDLKFPAFLDPFCGSGTLLIEACLMALGVAPSYLRSEADWLHKNLLFFSANDWDSVRSPIRQSTEDLRNIERKSVTAVDLNNTQQNTIFCHGFDIDPRSLTAARSNISAALLAPFIAVKQCDITDLELPPALKSAASEGESAGAMLVSNPPYGSRLGDQEKLKPVYAALGDLLFEQCQSWEAAILSGNPELGWQTRLRSWRQHKVYNGSIECKLQRYSISPRARLGKIPQNNTTPEVSGEGPSKVTSLPQRAVAREALSTDATMVFNRLGKNRKRLAKMRSRTGLAPFRLYDRDLPEFAFMVDCYPLLEGDMVNNALRQAFESGLAKDMVIHVQEYVAPTTVDPARAQERADDFLNACSAFFERPISELSIKRRERQRGAKQYQKSGLPWAPTTRDAESVSGKAVSAEGQFKFYIDLKRYLDTGIFIDSRGAREWIARESKGKNFLNLFAYTATATLAAISGGAKSSLSLDMSATYLAWAKENLVLNGFDLRRHQLHRADCLVWLAEPGPKFDLILLDPPSFSNSKKMQETLDIRRDHSALISKAMARLQPQGKLLFCTNKSGFKLSESLHTQFNVEPTTHFTLHEDCVSSKHAHCSWVFEHKANA